MNHGDHKSPKDRVGLDPFQMAMNSWLIFMGVILTTYKSWDDPLILGGFGQIFLGFIFCPENWGNDSDKDDPGTGTILDTKGHHDTYNLTNQYFSIWVETTFMCYLSCQRVMK